MAAPFRFSILSVPPDFMTLAVSLSPSTNLSLYLPNLISVRCKQFILKRQLEVS